MDVPLTDEQIGEVELFLTYPARAKTTGVPFESVRAFGTRYTASPAFEIYAWELSEDLYKDDNGNIKPDSGSSHSIVITSEINEGILTIIGVTTPPTEGGGHIFPEYFQSLEISSESVITQLHEKNMNKAEIYYELFPDSAFLAIKKYVSLTLTLYGISKEYISGVEPETVGLIANLIDDRKEDVYVEMPSEGVLEIAAKYSDGNMQSIYLWTADGITLASPLTYGNRSDWKPGNEFTWTLGTGNIFEEIAALIK